MGPSQAAASAGALRRWSLNELRAARSSSPLVETLRARASRLSEALSLQRAALPADCAHLQSASQKLSSCLSSFKSASPHAAVSNLDRTLRACVEGLRDAPEPERLHPASQLLLSSGFASLISSRVVLWRIDQLDGPRAPPLPSSTDGWNPTDVPAAEQATGPGVFGQAPHLSDLVFAAVDDTRAFGREKFGDVPEVTILHPHPPAGGASTCDTFASAVYPADGPVVAAPYVQFVLHEVLKNALAAHVYRAGVESIGELPDIQLRYGIRGGWGHIAVQDHGGGWPAGGADRAALFLCTTRPGRARGHDEASWQYSRAHGAQLEGLGAGLALADLHARFLGGSLSLGGLPGQGAHAAFSFDVTGDRTDASPLLLW